LPYLYIVYSKTKDNGHILKIKTYIFAEENSQVYGVCTNMRIHAIPATISVTAGRKQREIEYKNYIYI